MEDGCTEERLCAAGEAAIWLVILFKMPVDRVADLVVEYAAAFFLLAGKLKDAVNVCANQMKDLQLAIAICRVYGGDDCVELEELLEDKVLPQAAREGNRWLASWAFWMLKRRDMAVRALIVRLYSPLQSFV